VRHKELRQLIKGGESERVELKVSFDKEALETSVAFANTQGGSILIGASDKGEIKGIQIGKEMLKDCEPDFSEYRTSYHS